MSLQLFASIFLGITAILVLGASLLVLMMKKRRLSTTERLLMELKRGTEKKEKA